VSVSGTSSGDREYGSEEPRVGCDSADGKIGLHCSLVAELSKRCIGGFDECGRREPSSTSATRTSGAPTSGNS